MGNPRRALPSMKALQVLECVARTRSFKDAANELFVTPAAVSFQIRQLEKDLDTRLFDRTPTGVKPTPAGEAFIPKLTAGIETLHEAFQDFLTNLDDTPKPVRVTAGPAVMSKWLVREVQALKRQSPKIEIEFSSSLGLSDLVRDNIDYAIRFGTRPDHSIKQEIAEEYLVPAISPSLAKSLKHPQDLAHFDLIHDQSLQLFDDTAPSWETWFTQMGLNYEKQRFGMSFSQSDHAIQAAVAGAGVGLVRVILAGPELISGQLVVPFGPAIPTGLHYYLLSKTQEPQTAESAEVMDWLANDIGHTYKQLIEEAKKLRQLEFGGIPSNTCFRTATVKSL